jgi:hypothetical protein
VVRIPRKTVGAVLINWGIEINFLLNKQTLIVAYCMRLEFQSGVCCLFAQITVTSPSSPFKLMFPPTLVGDCSEDTISFYNSGSINCTVHNKPFTVTNIADVHFLID